MAQPHFCPYCQSTDTVPILKDPTRRQYLCQECQAVHWVPDTSASGDHDVAQGEGQQAHRAKASD
jgi:transposase-like protein